VAEGASERGKVKYEYVPSRNTNADCFQDTGAMFSAAKETIIIIIIIIINVSIMLTIKIDSRQRQEIFFLHNVQTGSGAHPASYPLGTGGSFPGDKVAGP
jgi:hypothetical protein